MREVIQKIIEAEGEAKRLVEATRAKGERLLSKAQKQAQELTARVEREVRVEAERILATASEEAEREKRKELARTAAEIESQIRLDEAAQQRAVEAVGRCGCGLR